MNNDYQRNQEIEHSLKIGAKVFAMGALLVLVLSVTGMPHPSSGDAIIGMPATPAVVSDPTAAPANPEAATATARIEVPFKANQGDVEELPSQF